MVRSLHDQREPLSDDDDDFELFTDDILTDEEHETAIRKDLGSVPDEEEVKRRISRLIALSPNTATEVMPNILQDLRSGVMGKMPSPKGKQESVDSVLAVLRSVSIPPTKLDEKSTAAHVANTMNHADADDVLVLDIRGLTPVADWFVMGTARGRLHMRAIRDELLDACEVPAIEGDENDDWIALAVEEEEQVVAHIFTAEGREHWALDSLWSNEGCDVITSKVKKGDAKQADTKHPATVQPTSVYRADEPFEW